MANYAVFFKSNTETIKRIFLIAISTFTFEVLATLYIVSSVNSQVRFKGFLSVEHIGLVYIVLFFFVRVFAVHLVLGAILTYIAFVFSIKRRWIFYFLLFSYAYLRMALIYPQIFDEFYFLGEVLKTIKLFKYPWVVAIPIVCLICQLVISGVRAKAFTKSKILRTISVLFALLVYFSAHFNRTDVRIVEDPNSPTMTSTIPKNIIIVSVDSLVADIDFKSDKNISSGFRDFLDRSTGFDRVITPIAQTHASLYSLFSGEEPTTSGVRTNLPRKALDTDELFNNDVFQRLKQLGFEIQFVKDVSEYAYFAAGKMVDKVEAPHFPTQNIFLSVIFRNVLVFGLFDNFVGYFFLPEIDNNNSFIYSYNLKKFTQDVVKKIAQINLHDKRQLLFIHSCNLHWPGFLPFPYYPQDSFPKHKTVPFGYRAKFHGLTEPVLTADQWKEQSHFNRRIYASGVKNATVNFLNPIFDQIKASGLDKNSIIILMSDHGEDLWPGNRKYPLRKYVQHSTSLVFESFSEMNYMRILFPGKPAQQLSGTVGLIDIFPTILDSFRNEDSEPVNIADGHSLKNEIAAGKISEKIYYTETGLWPFSLFSEQFRTTPPINMGPLFRWDSKSKNIFVDPKHMPGVIQQKQRALYRGSYRYTLYPTLYGYQEFLCNRKIDFACEKNEIRLNADFTKLFRDEMAKHLMKDQMNGMLKGGPCSLVNRTKFNYVLFEVDKYQWQYYYHALECLHNYHDFDFAAGLMASVYSKPGVNNYLRSQIKKTLLEMCTVVPGFLTTDGKEKFDCKGVRYDAFHKSFFELFQFHKTEKYSHSRLIDQMSLAEVENSQNWNAVLQIYMKNESTLEGFNKELINMFSMELEYGFQDTLEPYYFGRLAYLWSRDRARAVFEISRDLARNRNLNLKYYDFAVELLDSLPVPNHIPKVRSVERATLKEAQFRMPVNYRIQETQIALKRSVSFICAEKSRRNLCQKVKNFLL